MDFDNSLPFTFEEFKTAAGVFFRLSRIRSYVSKERFVQTAKARFGIEDDRKHDVLYGLFQECYGQWYRVLNHQDDKLYKQLPLALEIAQAAYSYTTLSEESTLPSVNADGFTSRDRRRYFYRDSLGNPRSFDVCLADRFDLMVLSDMIKDRSVEFIGCAQFLDKLHLDKNGGRQEVPYFDGDIYFLYGNPTDRIFYDWWSHGDDSGVYVATEKGWLKLLYTPGRGYIDKDGKLQYVDEKQRYSDYMLEGSGKDCHYVGNIYDNLSVLKEKNQ